MDTDQSTREWLRHFPEMSDDEKHRLTVAGLADVDAGRTISHEDVLLWIQFLARAADTK